MPRAYGRRLWVARNAIVGFPDGRSRRSRHLVLNRTKEAHMNWGVIITFAVVIAGALFVAYGLIRPFTHVHHDHRDVFHP